MNMELYKNIIYIKNNILYIKDIILYNFDIKNTLDEFILIESINIFKLDLIKYKVIKEALNNIKDVKVDTIKDATGKIFIQDIKIFYNCKDRGNTYRNISFTFFKNNFIFGV